MIPENYTVLSNLLGKLSEELIPKDITTAEFNFEESRLVDCIVKIIDHLKLKEGSND
jgi:hypothetical protein